MRLLAWFIVLMLWCSDGYGQGWHRYGDKGVWRKRVMRDVPLPEGADTLESFLKRIIEDVVDGKLSIYASANLSERKLKERLAANLESHRDVDTLEDPVEGTRHVRTVLRKRYDDVKVGRFRLGEEWVYDLSTRKTTISITSVAMTRDIHLDNGEYVGSNSLFWMGWKDFAYYMRANGMDSMIGAAIWHAYMSDTGIVPETVEPAKVCYDNKVWSGSAVRYVFSRNVYLKEIDEPSLINLYDTSICRVWYAGAMQGKVTAYYNDHFRPGKPLAANEMAQVLTGARDTILMVDPVTGKEVSKVVVYDANIDEINNYGYREQWTMDVENGVTTIDVPHAAPLNYDKVGKERKWVPLFWLRYGDTLNVLKRHSEYNYLNNPEWLIWMFRFNELRRKGGNLD